MIEVPNCRQYDHCLALVFSLAKQYRGAVDQLRSNAGLASALRPAILRLARRLRQMRAHDHDLGTGQLQAMGALFRQGPMPIGELAALEKVRPPSMTRTVNALEEQGLAVREDSEADRRHCVVRLTDAGRELVLADRRRRDAWLAKRVAELTPEEREVLRRAIPVLEKVNH